MQQKNKPCIGIAAASSPFNHNLFQKGISKLEALGFTTSFNDDIFKAEGYLAGDDNRRKAELESLFENKNINIIMFARGGYGSQRIISKLNLDLIKNNPKPVIGFSDVTPLLNFLNTKARCPIFYGPVVTQFGNAKTTQNTIDSFCNALSGKNPFDSIKDSEILILNNGDTEGSIIGGCLSLVTSSIGTSYDIETKDKILFLEDTNEKLYSFDRMLNQLINSNKFTNVKGIIFGHLDIENKEKAVEIIKKDLSHLNIPIIADFPSGHNEPFLTIPFGKTVSLSTDPFELSFTHNQ